MNTKEKPVSNKQENKILSSKSTYKPDSVNGVKVKHRMKKDHGAVCVDDLHPDLMETHKIYVGNLRPRVSNKMLETHFNAIVPIDSVNIIVDNVTTRSKGYGFVTCKREADVERLLNLPPEDRFIRGGRMVIRRARKRFPYPGCKGYVKPCLSDRRFNLDPADSSLPTIHCLVDDILFKVFSLLSIEEIIRQERVCRRWQQLVYNVFSSTKRLDLTVLKTSLLRKSNLQVRGAINKHLILTGDHLEHLKLDPSDNYQKSSILRTVGQLCNSLKSLDVSLCSSVNYASLSCITHILGNLTSFTAKACSGLYDKGLQVILSNSPNLESLNIVFTNVKGECFDNLPKKLKKFNGGATPLDVSVIHALAKNCPELEALELMGVRIEEKILIKLGEGCPQIKELSIAIEPLNQNYAFLESFPNLRMLSIQSTILHLDVFIPLVRNLEVLDLDIMLAHGDIDFSVLTNIKELMTPACSLSTKDLESIPKCSTLQIIKFKGENGNLDLICEILKNCPDVHYIDCRNVVFSQSANTISKVKDAMKHKKVKVKLVFSRGSYIPLPLDTCLKGSNYEIEFLPHHMGLLVNDWDFDDDDDYSDAGSFSSYYSDFDNVEDNWFVNYLADPDEMLYEEFSELFGIYAGYYGDSD